MEILILKINFGTVTWVRTLAVTTEKLFASDLAVQLGGDAAGRV